MSETKTGTITFRLDAALKEELTAIAETEAKPMGEVLRELVRDHVKQRKRREWEAEVRRQCLEAAEVAKDPNSDEAQLMRELDANFEEFARDLAEREKKLGHKWK